MAHSKSATSLDTIKKSTLRDDEEGVEDEKLFNKGEEVIKFRMKIESIQKRLPPVFVGYVFIVTFLSIFYVERSLRVSFVILTIFDTIVNVIASRAVMKSTEIDKLRVLELAYFCKTIANATVRFLMQVYMGRDVPIWIMNLYALLTITHTSYFRKHIGFLNFLVMLIGNSLAQFISFTISRKEFEDGGRYFSITHLEKQTPYNLHNIWDSEVERRIKLLEPIIACILVVFIGYVFEGLVEQQYDDTISSRIALVNQRELNKSKSKFISSLAHELRNPLHGLLVTVELMQLEVKKCSDRLQNFDFAQPKSFVDHLLTGTQTQIELLSDVESNSKILMDVFSNSLQICNLELGKVKINNSPFNILDVTDSITSVFGNLALEKGLVLQSILDVSHVPLHLIGDHVRLSQILINCVSNSVKYTKKGKVVLHCSLCKAGDGDYPFGSKYNGTNDTVCLRIVCEDTGIGIPKHEINNLFQAFHTVDGVSSSVDFERYYTESIVNGDSFHERHGLGLSISNQFIELMQGKVNVESEVNVGTKMTIYLPFNKFSSGETSSNVSEKLKDIKNFKIGRIYILDHCETMAEIIEKLCKAVFPNITCFKITNTLELNDLLGNYQIFMESTKDLILFHKHAYSDIMENFKNCITIPTIRKGEEASNNDLCLPTRLESFINNIHSHISKTPLITRTIHKSSSDQFSVFHTKKVLVVDDNEVNRKVLQKMTSILGFEAKVASDGLEAFEMYKKEPYDLVLLDLLMPILSGKECCKLIRSIGPTECKIVAVTANIWESNESLIEAGFDLVLKKPISMKDLKKELLPLF